MKTKVTPAVEARMIVDRKNGLTRPQLAQKYRVSESSAGKVIRRNGLQVRITRRPHDGDIWRDVELKQLEVAAMTRQMIYKPLAAYLGAAQ